MSSDGAQAILSLLCCVVFDVNLHYYDMTRHDMTHIFHDSSFNTLSYLYGRLRLSFDPSHCGLNDYEIDGYSTEPFARPLSRSLAPLTHSLRSALLASASRAPDCAHSLAPELVGKRCF